MLTRRVLIVFVGLYLPLAVAPSVGEPLYNSLRLQYDVASDYSYVLTITRDVFVRGRGDVKDAAEYSRTFDPATASVRLAEGWVDQPDGTRLLPAANAVVTRPSAASRDAPGFVSTETTTIVLPQVTIGSHVHLKIEQQVRRKPLMGFNAFLSAGLFSESNFHVSIAIPAGLPLNIGHQSGFAVTDATQDGIRHIEADVKVRGVSPRDEEPHMVASSEIEPMFLATSLKSYEDLGAIYYRASADKASVTPEIKALADRIVGQRKGVDAARAIYDWVAANVRYLAVWLQSDENWVPHDATTVMKNGYGDCKDHVVLMQALLAAAGIRSAPVLVNWDNRSKPLPIWSAQSFNHTIIYLPDYDIFANPTSPFTPFGVLDQDLSGKLVVVASENPEVRNTPAIVPAAATFTTTADIAIASDGTVTGQAAATMTPALEMVLRSRLHDPDSNARLMRERLAATPEGGFGYIVPTDAYDLDKPFQLTLGWRSPHGVYSGSPAYLLPSAPPFAPIAALQGFLSATKHRIYPIEVPVRDLQWTLNIDLPSGRATQNLPRSVQVDNETGTYSATYERAGASKLVVHRRLILKQSVVTPSHYLDLESIIYAFLEDQRAILITTPQ